MTTPLDQEIATYTAANPKSASLHEKATNFMPGGDTRNSIYWDPFPLYITDGTGTTLTDVDGNKRTDFVNNMTTLILGHKPAEVTQAVAEQLDHGMSFPAPSPSVVRWAELMCERVPSLDKVRFVNTGTEATLNAIRAARAFSGNQKLVKCEGAYHGNHDAIQISVVPPLDKAGDAESPESVKAFPGISETAEDDIYITPFNDIVTAEKVIREHADELAAVIVEPVNGQCGMVPGKPEFLEGLRRITDELGIILIFDEVIAFRIAYGGAQDYYGVTPDLTCFGKVVGGGMPVGAFGGREDIMSMWDPSGGGATVQHAGTFNGNPMTAAAGVATLENLTPEKYEYLDNLGESLRTKLRALFAELEVPMGVTGVASLFALQFTPTEVVDYRTFATNDKNMLNIMFIGLLNEGFLMSNRCAGNVSTVHTEDDVDAFVTAVRNVLKRAGYA
ncbi:aspartate aminotransferase family protein [Candidatus Lucifugimonas marina]|jgi:glutamate-1-semialdehyde 2,1-aminomutase|uniref:glutamate-1-semialdehyde 2,1-aminomutase n=1 Tax=Candidatus Lucifugimonas marina TaxID=3038979 RepID=A0AAJ6CTL2_9CHLR|nr:aminotransferase class III-fold pyridoxal phosphate-dependent enzyme [SAR202 cluster bacterium JH702]MDG0869637.1 aminotransferase class III-fold pyridoxal phosphate-dependent enzyme [SAR202 cluster bacterium JH639]WFG34370.1 aminotransferase class III-fold pyridoxal phosphate-dependent enzyme [SAR202 cluster bacterium JH545]WFG38299.1 aminotransferase class III-fold pyridoxal phosphate-dependent enzyme [SAR202 cluster bacterium JH1073]